MNRRFSASVATYVLAAAFGTNPAADAGTSEYFFCTPKAWESESQIREEGVRRKDRSECVEATDICRSLTFNKSELENGWRDYRKKIVDEEGSMTTTTTISISKSDGSLSNNETRHSRNWDSESTISGDCELRVQNSK